MQTDHSRSALNDPLVRLTLGSAGVVATAAVLDRDRVGPREERFYRAVNQLPDEIYGPAWIVMQCGALGAAPVAAAIAWRAGERRLASQLILAGASAWALSKVVKRIVRRPRPAALVAGSRHRGKEAAGLGYLSGHAGVVVAMGLVAWPHLGPRTRAAVLAAAPIVGLSRIYVGAHLPLDVVGGASLGVAVNAAVSLLDGDTGSQARGR